MRAGARFTVSPFDWSCRAVSFFRTGPVYRQLLDLSQISSSGYNDCHYRDDARSNGPKKKLRANATFWAQAIYTELLHASSRFHARRDKKQKRHPHRLVKILCLPFQGILQERYDRRHDSLLCFETLLGASSW